MEQKDSQTLEFVYQAPPTTSSPRMLRRSLGVAWALICLGGGSITIDYFFRHNPAVGMLLPLCFVLLITILFVGQKLISLVMTRTADKSLIAESKVSSRFEKFTDMSDVLFFPITSNNPNKPQYYPEHKVSFPSQIIDLTTSTLQPN